MNNLINGENFKKLANIVIDQNTYLQKRIYRNNDIIFCKTDYLSILFSEINDHANNYYLITHQSDYEINEYIFLKRPKSIKKWFAQNVNYKHEDLIPLPIGLENHEGPSKGTFTDFNLWANNYNINDKYEKSNLVYCNFNPNNHLSRKYWISELSKNGIHTEIKKTTYSEHINNLKRSYFCISPRGNGIDCHRTWEALYLDCIPIVPEHLIYNKFSNKILQTKDPIEITEKFLNQKMTEMQSKMFDKNKLTLSYWQDIIINT